MANAVVIGGSLAGLLAARALSDHVEQVTVIERDQLPEEPIYRNGVPQARHVHVLLAKGHEVLAQFFPTLEEDFAELGIPNIDITRDSLSHTAGGWIKRFSSGVISNPVSRMTIDWYVYQKLRQRANISFLPQTEAQRLIASDDNQTVTGVEVTSREDQSTRTLLADLVVDASGRSTKTPQWLQALGYPVPPQTLVNSYQGYASRWYELSREQLHDAYIVLVTALAAKGNYRGGVIQLVEKNQAVVTLGGINKVYPPTDEDGFLEFARQLASPVIYEAIRDAKPLTPVYGYRRTENVWNHYERLPRHPGQLIVMGDAYCGFNPVYGQGMTVAAMEAQQLDILLRQCGADGLRPAAFYQALARVVETPWLLATGEDLRYPGTEGDRPGLAQRLAQKYVDRLIAVLPHDEVATRAFVQVSHLLAPPAELFRPGIVARVLRHSLRPARRDGTRSMPVSNSSAALGD